LLIPDPRFWSILGDGTNICVAHVKPCSSTLHKDTTDFAVDSNDFLNVFVYRLLKP